MPIETGPTMYLPNSQKYLPGYLATDLPEFAEYFQANYVQLPLEKGDAVFFNPALFHGAGTNHSADVKRMANLLQISSAFGRAMDAIDRVGICTAICTRRWCSARQAGASRSGSCAPSSRHPQRGTRTRRTSTWTSRSAA